MADNIISHPSTFDTGITIASPKALIPAATPPLPPTPYNHCLLLLSYFVKSYFGWLLGKGYWH
ncbi:hypothetical protein [Candidatus Odyssella thessalonicensis]|uniref:hypothetical protein n=1 Tax=Candidatus Odyssella thessalonicensis TaxID=84647 RepID=UPI001111C325|nr:hypothetical protein [Candidatus Odyssella thessalonicensis]